MMSTPGENFRTVVESATALIVAWVAFHQAKIKSDVNKIEISINSRMSTLLKTVEEASRAKGVIDEQQRAAAQAVAVESAKSQKENG